MLSVLTATTATSNIVTDVNSGRTSAGIGAAMHLDQLLRRMRDDRRPPSPKGGRPDPSNRGMCESTPSAAERIDGA